MDAIGVTEPDRAAVGGNALRRMDLVGVDITTYVHSAIDTNVAVKDGISCDVYSPIRYGNRPRKGRVAERQVFRHIGIEVGLLLGENLRGDLRGDAGHGGTGTNDRRGKRCVLHP